MVTQVQLDLVTAQSTPTRMIRKFMSVFYSEDRLAHFNCFRTSNSKDGESNDALDSDMVAMSISK